MNHGDLSAKCAALLAVLLLPMMASAGSEGGSPGETPPSEHCAAQKAASTKASTAEVRLMNLALRDQEGKPVKFSSEVLGDKLVVMDFVFTHCTTVCPVLSAIFARVQNRLGERLGAEVRMVSISVDPTRDTPARLKAYSTQLGAKPGWTWLTGSQEDVKQVLEGLGAYTADYANHAPMVLVGDPRTGKWVRLNGFPKEEQILQKVEELAEARRKAASAAPPAKDKSKDTSKDTSKDKDRNYFTDTVLLTQDGKQVRFFSDVLRDKVVVISFLFTRCVTACPLIAQKLKTIQAQLGEQFGREVHFISISVDPEHDTPQKLREFARKHEATHEGWTFLTGKKQDVDLVIARLGQYVENIEGHSTMFLAGNVKNRHWTKLRPDMPPSAVAERVRLLAGEK